MLRPYQTESVNALLKAIHTKTNTILQLPTGTGKTTVIAELIKQWKSTTPNSRALIIVHRIELVDQMIDRFIQFGIIAGKIQSGEKVNLEFQIQVGLIQSLRNDGRKPATVSLIIIDEAHHITANTYQNLIQYYDSNKPVILGVTATPSRLDGAPLGKTFNQLLQYGQINDFVSNGYLSPMKHYATGAPSLNQINVKNTGDYDEKQLEIEMSKDLVMADLIKGYEQHAKGKKTIVFAVNTNHASLIAARFQKKGYSAVSIDYKTDSKTRNELVEKFKNGKIQILCNVNLFTEGFDCPDVEVVQLARPTKSLNLYLQMVGRGMRIFPGKEFGVILDNAKLWEEHGLSSRNRIWNLDGLEKEKKRIIVKHLDDENEGQSDSQQPEESNKLELIEIIIEEENQSSKSDSQMLNDVLFFPKPILILNRDIKLYNRNKLNNFKLRTMSEDAINIITGQGMSYYIILKKIQSNLIIKQSAIASKKFYEILHEYLYNNYSKRVHWAHLTYYYITIWHESEEKYNEVVKMIKRENNPMTQIINSFENEDSLFDLNLSELFIKSIQKILTRAELKVIYDSIQEKYFDHVYESINNVVFD
jgi:superfamily II DNA or RNA helicase